METVDVAIAGGSFAGLSCAHGAARRGLRTMLLERKADVGAGVRTTGILVKEVAERYHFPLRLTRRITGVRLYSPSFQFIDLTAPDYYFLATDTPGILRWLADKARDAGARISLGCPYVGARQDAKHVRVHGIQLNTRFLVGADGPNSRVAIDFGLGRNTSFLIGAEWEYEGIRDVPDDRLHCFLDSKLAPGYIAWVVPGVGITQVGLACSQRFKPDVGAFVGKLSKRFDFSRARIAARRGGVIPCGGTVWPVARGNVLLTGDAAGLVSPLTAGGIHTALHFGAQTAEVIADHIIAGQPHPAEVLPRRYPGFLKKRLLRMAMDVAPPNSVIELALSNPLLRALARRVFFRECRFRTPLPDKAAIPGAG